MLFTFVLAKKCPPLLLYPLLLSLFLMNSISYSNGTLKTSVQMLLLVTLVRNQEEHELSCSDIVCWAVHKCCWVFRTFLVVLRLSQTSSNHFTPKMKITFSLSQLWLFSRDQPIAPTSPFPAEKSSWPKNNAGRVHGLWYWNFGQAKDIFLRNSEPKQS